MFSSAKPSFCSNFQTYKKEFLKTSIQFFFFQLKNWPVHFPLDLHQIGFLCLQNRNQIEHKSFCKWQNILDDGYEFQIKRLLGLRNSKIKQKCLWNVKQHEQIAKMSKKVQYREAVLLRYMLQMPKSFVSILSFLKIKSQFQLKNSKFIQARKLVITFSSHILPIVQNCNLN